MTVLARLHGIRPHRFTVAAMTIIYIGLAVIWWWSAERRADGAPIDAANLAAHFAFGHRPMHVWALLFTVLAAWQLGGIYLRRSHVAGYAVMVGAGVLLLYGVLTGASATSNPMASFGGLVSFAVIALWHSIYAFLLLGDDRRTWE